MFYLALLLQDEVILVVSGIFFPTDYKSGEVRHRIFFFYPNIIFKLKIDFKMLIL